MTTRDDILKNLTDTLEVIQPKAEVLPAPIVVDDEQLIADAQTDYEYARMRMKKLIETSDEVISNLNAIATDAEHPRAYEVLGNLIKQSADMTQQLLDLQKQRKNLIKDEKSKGQSTTTNNAIFVGTTTELQKFLNNQNQQP